MKKLFENFRNYVNEGDLTDAEEKLKDTPDSKLSAAKKKEKKGNKHKPQDAGTGTEQPH